MTKLDEVKKRLAVREAASAVLNEEVNLIKAAFERMEKPAHCPDLFNGLEIGVQILQLKRRLMGLQSAINKNNSRK